MDGALVDAHGRARFHSSRTNAVAGDALGEVWHGRFGTAPAGNHLAPHMQQSVQKGARGDDHALGPELNAPHRAHTHSLALFHQQFVGLVLPDVESVDMVEHLAPFPNKAPAVALCPWAPHGRSLALVEHAELNGRGISDKAHVAPQGINLAHNLPLGNAAHGRVARHLCNFVHVYGNKAGFCPHVGSRRSGFASGVSAADNDNVVFQNHL